MEKKNYFIAEESPLQPNKWIIRPNHAQFYLKSTEGSFNVIMARLMGLTYAQYLRFCRDLCRGEIVGKNNMYPVVYFPRGEMLNMLVRTLNTRAAAVDWERQRPDWEEHAAQLKPEFDYKWN